MLSLLVFYFCRFHLHLPIPKVVFICVCHKLLVTTDLISAITQNPFEHSHRLLVQGTRDNFLVSHQKYVISAAERRKERKKDLRE